MSSAIEAAAPRPSAPGKMPHGRPAPRRFAGYRPSPLITRLLIACGLAMPLLLTWAGKLNDIYLYHAWAQEMAAGRIPYRDFPVEYPPLALAAVTLPYLLGHSLRGFATAFMLTMGLLALLQKALLWQYARRPALFLAVACTLEALLYFTYLKRFDVLAALVTSVALVRIGEAPRRRSGWWCLGLGAAIKLYPLVLLGPCCAYAARRVSVFRAWFVGPATAGLAFLATLAAARLCCGEQAESWWTYHHHRGLHLPSTYTAVYLMAGHLFEPIDVGVRFGAMQILMPWADEWAERSTAVLAGALALSFLVALPRVRTVRSLWRACVTCVCALLLFAKVCSPQFFAWLVPLLALAGTGVRLPAPSSAADSSSPAGAAAQGGEIDTGIDWPLLLLGFIVVLCTGQLFPSEGRLSEPLSDKRIWLLVRTAALTGLWLWAMLGRLDTHAGRARGQGARVPRV